MVSLSTLIMRPTARHQAQLDLETDRGGTELSRTNARGVAWDQSRRVGEELARQRKYPVRRTTNSFLFLSFFLPLFSYSEGRCEFISRKKLIFRKVRI